MIYKKCHDLKESVTSCRVVSPLFHSPVAISFNSFLEKTYTLPSWNIPTVKMQPFPLALFTIIPRVPVLQV